MKIKTLYFTLYFSLLLIFKSIIIIYYDLSSDFFYNYNFKHNNFEDKFYWFVILVKYIPPILLLISLYIFNIKISNNYIFIIIIISVLFFYELLIIKPIPFFIVTKSITINNLILSSVALFIVLKIYRYIKGVNS